MDETEKSLRIIHSSMCLGILLLILLLHFLVQNIDLSGLTGGVGIYGFVALGISSLSILFSGRFFQTRMREAQKESDTNVMVHEVRAAYIIRWAFLQGAILVNVLFYFFLEKHPVLIIVALLILLLLFVTKPKLK